MSILDYLKQPVYLVLIIIGLVLLVLMIKDWWRKQKIRLQQINEEDFGKVDKNYRPNRLKALKEDYPGLEEALTWLDAKLMQAGKERDVCVELVQEWCCEDRTGEGDYPMRTRPSQIAFSSGGAKESMKIEGFLEDDFLSLEDARVLRWALFERCKLLMPMRVYKVHTNKTTRNFTPKEGIKANWVESCIIKEDYQIEIKKS